jgi:HSP20 family protein
MALVKWEPFSELEEIQSRLNRFFGSTRAGDEAIAVADWSPAMDVQETSHEYAIKADLPDVKKDDVKVTLEHGVLAIEGERRFEKEEKDKKFHRIERSYGKFVRRFALPTEVDAAKVKAEFKDGVLSVVLPKSANAVAQTIDVKVA